MSDKESNQKFYYKPIFVNIFLLGINILLFVIKIIFAFLTNSLALQADAFDNLTDIIMVVTSLIGIIYTRKKPNEKFPYGYYRLENVVSLIISIFIFFTAYTIIRESIIEITNFINGVQKEILVNPLVLIIISVSIFLSIITTIYLKIVGTKSESQIIESEASEKLLDNLISSSVFVGFIIAYFNIFILDSILGLIIAIFIIKGGFDIFITSTKTLLDAVIDFDKRTDLYELIESFPKVKGIDNLEIRSYGKYIFVEADLELSKDMALSNIDLLKKKLTNKIKKQFPKIFKIVITSHSEEEHTTKIAVPLEDNKGLDSKLYDRYGEAPYFALLEIKGNDLSKFEIYQNKFLDREKRKGILISDWLSSQNIDKIYTLIDLMRGPKLVFENSFIEMVKTEYETLKEIVDYEKNLP